MYTSESTYSASDLSYSESSEESDKRGHRGRHRGRKADPPRHAHGRRRRHYDDESSTDVEVLGRRARNIEALARSRSVGEDDEESRVVDVGAVASYARHYRRR